MRGKGVLRFRTVIGRCNDAIQLGDGSTVHSEAFSHAVRQEREVRGFQVIAEGSVLRLDILAGQLTPALDAGIRSRLSKIHPELGGWESNSFPTCSTHEPARHR